FDGPAPPSPARWGRTPAGSAARYGRADGPPGAGTPSVPAECQWHAVGPWWRSIGDGGRTGACCQAGDRRTTAGAAARSGGSGGPVPFRRSSPGKRAGGAEHLAGTTEAAGGAAPHVHGFLGGATAAWRRLGGHSAGGRGRDGLRIRQCHAGAAGAAAPERGSGD